MAKLRDLRDAIGTGNKAVLRLAKDRPENTYGLNIAVQIYKAQDGVSYTRKLISKENGSPLVAPPPMSWEELFTYKDGIEATSDEWVIMPKDALVF